MKELEHFTGMETTKTHRDAVTHPGLPSWWEVMLHKVSEKW